MERRPTFAIDNGSLNTRVAFCDGAESEHIFEHMDQSPLESQYFFECRACRLRENPAVIGDDALDAWKKILDYSGVSWAIRDGQINSEQTMLSLWMTGIESVQRKMYGLSDKDELIEEKSDQLDLIITEKALQWIKHRQKMFELAFSILPDQGRLYLGLDSLFTLCSTGRTTGMVLETGYECTQCVPLYKGYCLPHAVSIDKYGQSDVTGKSVMSYLRQCIYNQTKDQSFSKKNWECQIPFLEKLMKKYVQVFPNGSDGYRTWLKHTDTLYIKEKKDVARISDLLYGQSLNDFDQLLPTDLSGLLSDMYGFGLPYTRIRLPDSKQSFLLTKEKHGAFEKDACSADVGSSEWKEWGSLETVGRFLPIHKCGIDIRQELAQSIVLSGGLSNIHGFNYRIRDVLRNDRKSESYRPKTIRGNKICKPGAQYCAVHGAQLLSGLSIFNDLWATHEDFDEYGSSIIYHKCII